jgi:integrase
MRVQVKKERDGVYYARWREGGRRPRRRFTTKEAVEAFARETEQRLALGGPLAASLAKLTLAEFVEEYWRTYAIPNLEERTRRSYKGVWNRHLRERIGNVPLRDITPAVVEDVTAQLKAAKVGDPTIIKALGFLQGVMKRAAVRGHIPAGANPVREVEKPRQRGVRRAAPLAPVTVERIRSPLRPFDRMLVTLLAYVGLRPEEAMSACLEHVTGSRLYVPATNHWPYDRDVDLLPIVQADLREWMMESGLRAPGLILPRPQLGAWTETSWRNWRRKVYQPAARAAGVTEDLRPYRLRGSYGSLLIHEGRSLTYVAAQLGHDVATLSKHYAGVISELEATGNATAADDAIRAARAAAGEQRASA